MAATESIPAKPCKDERGCSTAVYGKIIAFSSNVIRMFVSAFSRQSGSPFDSSSSCGFSAETLAAMVVVMTDRNLSGPYCTVREAVAALVEE